MRRESSSVSQERVYKKKTGNKLHSSSDEDDFIEPKKVEEKVERKVDVNKQIANLNEGTLENEM